MTLSLCAMVMLGATAACVTPSCEGDCNPVVAGTNEVHEKTVDCFGSGETFDGLATDCLTAVGDVQGELACEGAGDHVVCKSLGACRITQTLYNANAFTCPCTATTVTTPPPSPKPVPFVCDKYAPVKDCPTHGTCYNPKTCECEPDNGKWCWISPCWRFSGRCSIGHTCVPHTCNSCEITCDVDESFVPSPGKIPFW